MKTLHRYISFEILRNVLLSTALFIFIILMDRASWIAETVLGQGIGLTDFLSVLIKTIPSFLGIVIPISFVISVLITYIQMGASNEIVALKSCGISLKELSKPTIILGLIFSLLSFTTLMFLAPKSNIAVKKEIGELLKKRVTVNITPRSFSSNFPGVTFYVEKLYPEKGYIMNFMVSIQKKLQLITVFGEKGILRVENNSVFLDVFNGSAQIIDWKKPKEFKSLSFSSYTLELYKFSQKEKFKAKKYQNLFQLLKEKDTESLTEFLKRLSLSLAPLIVGLLAFSISVSLPRGAIGTGTTLGLTVIVLYYILYTVSKKLALKVGIPEIALTPDIIFSLITIPIYILAIKEKFRVGIGGRW